MEIGDMPFNHIEVPCSSCHSTLDQYIAIYNLLESLNNLLTFVLLLRLTQNYIFILSITEKCHPSTEDNTSFNPSTEDNTSINPSTEDNTKLHPSTEDNTQNDSFY